jgi:predicted nuclease of predicted toxin-antitoxin system
MKLLLDQDVYATTARFLQNLGHEVWFAEQLGKATAADEDLLRTAQAQGCLFVTWDRDFGHLVFVKGLGGGILYLRLLPLTREAVHQELALVLDKYTEAQLANAFVVIEADGHRFRSLPLAR